MKHIGFILLLCAGCQSWGSFWDNGSNQAGPTAKTCSAPGPFNQVSTVAGTTSGYSGDGGAATAAQLQMPYDVLVRSGEIYVSDYGNYRIRRISVLGNISTFLGNGTQNCTTTTTVNSPRGFTSNSNDLIFTEADGAMVRRAPFAGGAIVDVAGSCGIAGTANGTGGAARFNVPEQIARDSAGNLYVADSDNHRIRKIDTSLNVTTFCGTGTQGYAEGSCAGAQFSTPFGIAVDSNDNVLVADTLNCRIRKIANGQVSTLAGSGCGTSLDGTLTAGRIPNPGYLAIDECGTIYTVNSLAGRVRRISIAENSITTIAGDGSTGTAIDGPALSARFSGEMWGVTVDGSRLLVADTFNNRIRSVGP